MPAIDQFIDSTFTLLLIFDEPALFLLFFLKGAIIGKIFPTSIFLPGYLLVISASSKQVAISVSVASAGYVTGQLLIYWLSSYYGYSAVNSLPYVSVSNGQITRAKSMFQQYSGIGIFITNLLPFVGTFIMIPAGMSSYSIMKTVFYASSSTVLNYVLIVLVAFESIEFLGLV